MKQNKKSKKSTTKQSKFKVSPIIPIIAVIEVLVLIGVSSYAWFFVQANKEINSGTISVAADSGLDIDFQYSNVDDAINIWNYVGSDFSFEPATSLDGRTIYFPTSGSFDSTDTGDLVLRDGTVNDINSKYLSIDFELTNTSGYDQYVYLNNNSYFHVLDGASYQESRALRLALYPNDGNSGNVGSAMINSSTGSSDGGVVDTGTAGSNSYTVYFSNPGWGSIIYAHFYHEGGEDPDVNYSENGWPGVQMTRVTGSIYSVSIPNPVVDGSLYYDRVIFNNFNDHQTNEYTLKKVNTALSEETSTEWKGWHKFTSSADAGVYSENTIYLAKPYLWGDTIYCHAWASGEDPYTTYPGDKMTYVGSGIYSYSYDSSNTGGMLFDNGYDSGTNQTLNIALDSSSNGNLYYVTGVHSEYGNYEVATYEKKYADMTYKTVYLYNTFSWEKPYATVYRDNTNNRDWVRADIPLTSLSGRMYYCTVPEIYTVGCFRALNDSDAKNLTVIDTLVHQRVDRPKSDIYGEGAGETVSVNNGRRKIDYFNYADYIQVDGYPVISPGVSAGFQRPYAPVITIDAYSGLATEIVPAYSNSIDNYILGTGTPLFILRAHHMVSLSMIIWLEGTDEACYGNTYPGKNIDLRLEFSTEYYPDGTENDPVIVNPGDSNTFVYRFYDRTREVWTSDRQPTESGVTIAPVMQLYDNTTLRGYKMHAVDYASYDGKDKVSCWEVTAPQSIATLGHDIIFRRVNPYNEDEVWNYWHAGRVAGDPSTEDPIPTILEAGNTRYTVYDIARTHVENGDDIISFTAFSDGSPTEENLTAAYIKTHSYNADALTSEQTTDINAALTAADVPDYSCGGLWGNHTVRSVVLLDGLEGQTLRNDGAILTLNFSFPYKISGVTKRTATIEYKSSSVEMNALYYFVVPSAAYTNGVSCTVKRYTGFNGTYAINSTKNDRITFDRSFNGGTISGDYVEITSSIVSDAVTFLYWGSDMLVVQTNTETQDDYFSDYASNRLMQAHFFHANTAVHDGSYTAGDRYSYLYANENFAPPGGGTGFAAVVPNDATYYYYSVEYCGIEYNSDLAKDVTFVWHSTEQQDIVNTTMTVSDPFSGSTTVTVNHLNNNHICKITQIWATVYLTTIFTYINQDPRIHYFGTNNDDGNRYYTMERAASLDWVGERGNYYGFKYTVRISLFPTAVFQFPNIDYKISKNVDISPYAVRNGTILQCDMYVDQKPEVWNTHGVAGEEDDKRDTTVIVSGEGYRDAKYPHYAVAEPSSP